ncbi:hypothetical protein GCM10022214_50420 [Actinomadura miaoliensis]|uniref:Uncharacterized protein n=1 Tax=Actinomadura miaoliensis TaxID=430685 RepID=A0ABP7WA11_9ACTN
MNTRRPTPEMTPGRAGVRLRLEQHGRLAASWGGGPVGFGFEDGCGGVLRRLPGQLRQQAGVDVGAILMDDRRRGAWTTFMSCPAAGGNGGVPCRRAWSGFGRSPASVDYRSGTSGWPVVNTGPVSVQESAADSQARLVCWVWTRRRKVAGGGRHQRHRCAII